MRALLHVFVVLIAAGAAASGCAIVPRYQRGTLSDPAMDASSDNVSSRAMRKFHWAREGAAGGDGMAAGGGCGCGT
jgi:hypothetical protein